MARGWHYTKLSLSNARRLSFSGIYMCILLFLFLSLCRFYLFVFFFCSHWSLVDVPLISFCPADHVVPDWQPRIFQGCTGLCDGWMLARAPASTAQGLHHHGPRYFNFPYFCTMCSVEKLGIVDQNWLERVCPICC